jgi:hypothetical protein
MKNFLRGGLVLCGLLAANAVMTSASAVVLTFNNFAAFQAAATALTVENFDGAPWVDGSNPDGTTNLGLTWTAEVDLFGETIISRSATRSLTDGDFVNSDGLEQVNAALPDGTTAIGAFVDTYGQNHGVRMTASDAGDSLIGVIEGPMTASGTFTTFLGIISTTRVIATVSFVLDSDTIAGNDFAIDDVHFGQAAIPEPGTLSIFGLGIAGLVFARRKRMT